MTKLWNPTTQLTPLNNYLNNCVITSSYTLSYSPTWKPKSTNLVKLKTISPRNRHPKRLNLTLKFIDCPFHKNTRPELEGSLKNPNLTNTVNN
jgi:hypothetical protein